MANNDTRVSLSDPESTPPEAAACAAPINPPTDLGNGQSASVPMNTSPFARKRWAPTTSGSLAVRCLDEYPLPAGDWKGPHIAEPSTLYYGLVNKMLSNASAKRALVTLDDRGEICFRTSRVRGRFQLWVQTDAEVRAVERAVRDLEEPLPCPKPRRKARQPKDPKAAADGRIP